MPRELKPESANMVRPSLNLDWSYVGDGLLAIMTLLLGFYLCMAG